MFNKPIYYYTKPIFSKMGLARIDKEKKEEKQYTDGMGVIEQLRLGDTTSPPRAALRRLGDALAEKKFSEGNFPSQRLTNTHTKIGPDLISGIRSFLRTVTAGKDCPFSSQDRFVNRRSYFREFSVSRFSVLFFLENHFLFRLIMSHHFLTNNRALIIFQGLQVLLSTSMQEARATFTGRQCLSRSCGVRAY